MAENNANSKTWKPSDRDEGFPNIPLVRRRTTVASPNQSLTFEARDLREVKWNSVPPDTKGIQLGELVIDLHVYDGEKEIFEFPDGITLQIEYTAEDAFGSDYDPQYPDDPPKLSIITGWGVEDHIVTTWRRNETTVTPNRETGGGTLTTTFKELHPNDPQWVGRP